MLIAFHFPRRCWPLVILLLLLLAQPAPTPAHAQGPCGMVDAIDYPLDPAQFSIVYRFGMPSTRFDGRYHAGEDWFGTRRATYGAPVRAIARGRVTYAAPFGWGRDKGVVIIEHTFPDGTLWYSLYGHMEEVEPYTFPAVYTCVERGEIIGAIGRPRPAPHLHLEIRNFWPDSPGPGYWATDPTLSGWRRPARFIENWQAWFNPAHRWHGDLTDESGPQWPDILREDGALVVYDDGRLKALNPTGQVLWRYILSEDLNVVGVLPYQGDILVADYDGVMQRWSMEGGFIESWQLPHAVNSTPITWGDLLIVHTPDDELIAYGPDRTERWRVPDVPRPVTMQVTARLLGVASVRGTVTFVGLDGTVASRAMLRERGDLAPAPGDGFYVRSRYSLWYVTPDGTWRWLADSPATTRGTAALHSLPDGRFVVYSGRSERTLYAYDMTGRQQWAVTLPDLQGRPFILPIGDALLLADGYGHTAAVGAESGALCNQMHVWGNRGAAARAVPGPDGVLRLHIADQVIGLDWTIFAAGCR